MVFRLYDTYYPYANVAISTEEELKQKLIQLRTETPGRAVQLVSPHGDILDIALDQTHAFVQFTNHTMMPPYLVAVHENAPREQYHEFDVGGTATPISLRHCIEPEKAIEIALYFFRHGTIPDDIQWEGI